MLTKTLMSYFGKEVVLFFLFRDKKWFNSVIMYVNSRIYSKTKKKRENIYIYIYIYCNKNTNKL